MPENTSEIAKLVAQECSRFFTLLNEEMQWGNWRTIQEIWADATRKYLDRPSDEQEGGE